MFANIMLNGRVIRNESNPAIIRHITRLYPIAKWDMGKCIDLHTLYIINSCIYCYGIFCLRMYESNQNFSSRTMFLACLKKLGLS